MKKVKELKKWIELYNEVHASAEELQLAFDYVKEGIVSEEEIDETYRKAIDLIEHLEFRNMLRQEADQMSCVLKINSGAGGTESQDWASMLLRMYTRWAEANGYKISLANYQEGDEAGIKTATLNIEGDYAYGYLKGENGVHRKSILPPFRGTRSARVVPAVRTSTKWNRAYACATSSKTLTPARKRKSSSRTPRRATSPRTAKTPCANCAPSSTTKS